MFQAEDLLDLLKLMLEVKDLEGTLTPLWQEVVRGQTPREISCGLMRYFDEGTGDAKGIVW